MTGLVYVVDDDLSFLTAIGRLLNASGYEVITCATAAEFLTRPLESSRATCLLLDVNIPDLSGPELQNRLREHGSTVPIIFITGHGDIPTSVRAIKAGAEDFLAKPVAKDTLLGAVERALSRHRMARDEHARISALQKHLVRLTPRERQVFELVVRGKMNKQIAHELGTTERTIKAHRSSIMEKAQVRTLAELVSIAERLGILNDRPLVSEQ